MSQDNYALMELLRVAAMRARSQGVEIADPPVVAAPGRPRAVRSPKTPHPQVRDKLACLLGP